MIYFRKNTFSQLSFLSLLTLIPIHCFAHNDNLNQMNDSISFMGSMTFRNQGMTEQNQAWQLPGFFMGGHAIPADQGIELDEISIRGTKTYHDIWVTTQISHHTGHDSINIDEFSLTLPLEHAFKLQFGQMPSLATPLMQWHATNGTLADMPLTTSVFFGGHTQDQGIRLTKNFESSQTLIGAEIWQGDDWPSTSDADPITIFIKQPIGSDTLGLDLGAWYMSTEATNRMDERYSEDHHATITPLNANYLFSGDVSSAGAYFDLNHRPGNFVINIHGEFLYQKHDGILSDTAESSVITSEINGFLFEMNLNQMLYFGYESLKVENVFSKSVSSTFLNNSNLYNQGFEPERFYISWKHTVMVGLNTRISIIQEELMPQDIEYRFNIGTYWNFNV